MSYTIDVYRGQVKATRSFLDFSFYVTMFPQLVAGPIVRYRDIENQLRAHRIVPDQIALGIRRFIIGLAKKVLIANVAGSVADGIFAIPGSELTLGSAQAGPRAAVLYTILAGAKRHRIEPWAYLREILIRLHADDARLDEMLPDRWAVDHPDMVLSYRLDESRQKAARQRDRRQRRRTARRPK